MASLFPFSCLVTACLFSTLLLSLTSASTDPLDVTALQDLYGTLNYPPQLKGWRLKGGDPCEESWTGISCYGSSVIFIQLHGLELSGNLGGQLDKLLNLKQLDVSSNNIQGEIPFSLPPNATHINLACNKFSQSIPFSLTSLKHMHHLNLSHNSLSGPIGNVFTGLQNLRQMDLSYNDFTGDLRSSFAYLTNLTRLFLQNNKFTGSVNFLANLPLSDLNVQNNHFSGVIPKQFQLIPNLWINGNMFDFPEFRLMARYNGNESWKLGTLSLLMVVGSMLVILAVVPLVGRHQAAEGLQDPESREFACVHCKRDCCSKGGLEKHYHDRHPKFTFSCQDCVQKLPTSADLSYHTTNVHPRSYQRKQPRN